MFFTFEPPFGAGLSGYAAETGSTFLCGALGIGSTVRHADYLGSWLEVLREALSEDAAARETGAPRGHAIFRAASAAGKAADWLLARHTAAAAEVDAAREQELVA